MFKTAVRLSMCTNSTEARWHPGKEETDLKGAEIIIECEGH